MENRFVLILVEMEIVELCFFVKDYVCVMLEERMLEDWKCMEGLMMDNLEYKWWNVFLFCCLGFMECFFLGDGFEGVFLVVRLKKLLKVLIESLNLVIFLVVDLDEEVIVFREDGVQLGLLQMVMYQLFEMVIFFVFLVLQYVLMMFLYLVQVMLQVVVI